MRWHTCGMQADDPQLGSLPEVQRQVLVHRFCGDGPRTLADVASELGLSVEEVRRHEAAAFAAIAQEPA